ncbi:MAG: carbamoyltransferase HypF [Proteobacteria bacterium]|nr:carbamoyltransferase HypF [Pseudomonadota bacterium]
MTQTRAAPPGASRGPARVRVRLRGAVQGVGMRPFVHRLATELGLSGFVRNGAGGVVIEAEGDRLQDFLARLDTDHPSLARIDGLQVEFLAPDGGHGFAIAGSTGGAVATRIIADAATCEACLRDLFDPGSRFFRYPFVNCTQCGPRYTITRRLPYDRPQTAMAGFALCADCARDYADPANRRFHAEPIACPACGPRLSRDITAIATALHDGQIVALKGIGGFHLLCDARNERVVAELRRRKAREAKPFAVMVADDGVLDRIATPTKAERTLAGSVARPIVLMDARTGVLAPSVAPRLRRVGAMLAYAPVHHLLFDALPPGTALVATSANPGGEPLVVENGEAATRLGGIADLIVTHDRPIAVRADDSVAQIVAGLPTLLRRARGFVPDPVPLPSDGPCTLALGGHLKATVTLTRGAEAFVSQHVGDLDTAETIRFYRETIDHLTRILGVRPEAVACDLHPDYRSSQMAEAFGRPVIRVQHHAAHIAAVAAEHGVAAPVLGLALDGHGLGDDGGAWGGELMVVDRAAWRRIGGLDTLALPGGDRAAREPWRMGVAALHALGRGAEATARFPAQKLAGPLAARLGAGRVAEATSSLGRLFDAAAALLGVRTVQDYEGQAAMELEALVDAPRVLAGGWTWRDGRLSFLPLLAALAENKADGASLFHGTLIDGLAALAVRGATQTGIRVVCLGGGCVMNRVLAEGLIAALSAQGLTPLLPRAVPANDGGLSLGQAVMARADLVGGNPIVVAGRCP